VSYAGFHALLQTDPAVLAQLERIALAQTVMGVAAALIILLLLGAALLSFRTMRSAARLLRRVEKVAHEMAPRVDPLIEKATRIADDANDVSDSLRRKVHELTATLEELNVALRHAGRHAQQRVREFGAVVDVVQEEAEALLLDAAATARGVHTTAAALRTRPGRSSRPPGSAAATIRPTRTDPETGNDTEVP
jgi:uncharacterized protein YoxC